MSALQLARPARHRSCLNCYDASISESEQNVNNYLCNKNIVPLIDVSGGLISACIPRPESVQTALKWSDD